MTLIMDDTKGMDALTFKSTTHLCRDIGESHIVKSKTGEIEYINLWIKGRLQSYRDKNQNKSKNAILNSLARTNDSSQWIAKIFALGVRQDVVQLQQQCHNNGKKVKIDVCVYRKRLVKDYKNLIAGVDHMILDPMVRAGMLIDDSMKYIEWNVNQAKPEKEIQDGYECVYIRFQELR